MNELREKIACRYCKHSTDCDSRPTLRGEPKSAECRLHLRRADQILAILEPQMLTAAEARTLLECFEYDSLSRYSKVNRQAPLYLKLKKISEGE